VGVDARADLVELFEKLRTVDVSALWFVKEKQNRVVLRCKSHEEKDEVAELLLPPVPLDHIREFIDDLDFLLINFTSGKDVEKETLRKIRKEFKNPIFLDVHSLTLGDPDVKNRRRLRALRDWKEWLEGMDYVQFSWREAASLTGESVVTFAGVVEVADWLLEKGTQSVIVTRGAEGAIVFYHDEEGILKEEIPPFELSSIIDTTGCGDVFSAAFISYVIQTGDALKAGHFAAKAAALKATFSGLGPWLV
jgi:sugar/nucleoside kinase (ribokinase family)